MQVFCPHGRPPEPLPCPSCAPPMPLPCPCRALGPGLLMHARTKRGRALPHTHPQPHLARCPSPLPSDPWGRLPGQALGCSAKLHFL